MDLYKFANEGKEELVFNDVELEATGKTLDARQSGQLDSMSSERIYVLITPKPLSAGMGCPKHFIQADGKRLYLEFMDVSSRKYDEARWAIGCTIDKA